MQQNKSRKEAKVVLYFKIKDNGFACIVKRDYFNADGMIELPFDDGVIEIPDTIVCTTPQTSYEVDSIGPNVFEQVKAVRVIRIPKTVTDIEWSFYQCHKLERIEIDEANKVYSNVDGVLFSKDKKRLIYHPSAHGTEYRIPDGTVELANLSFKCNYKIQAILCPASLTTIGINTFYDCNALEHVYDIPETLKQFFRESRQKNHNVTKAVFHVGGRELSLNEMCEKYSNGIKYYTNH